MSKSSSPFLTYYQTGLMKVPDQSHIYMITDFRPVKPLNAPFPYAAHNIAGDLIVWYKNGVCIEYRQDGTDVTWYPPPTITEAVKFKNNNKDHSNPCCFTFKSNGDVYANCYGVNLFWKKHWAEPYPDYEDAPPNKMYCYKHVYSPYTSLGNMCTCLEEYDDYSDDDCCDQDYISDNWSEDSWSSG